MPHRIPFTVIGSVALLAVAGCTATGTFDDPVAAARQVLDEGLTNLTGQPALRVTGTVSVLGGYALEEAEVTATVLHDGTAWIEFTTADVARAADVFRPIYDASSGFDGRVSIEVEPRLAHDAAATIAEAKELWAKIDKPNVMIKIPATVEGLEAITAAIAAEPPVSGATIRLAQSTLGSDAVALGAAAQVRARVLEPETA